MHKALLTLTLAAALTLTGCTKPAKVSYSDLPHCPTEILNEWGFNEVKAGVYSPENAIAGLQKVLEEDDYMQMSKTICMAAWWGVATLPYYQEEFLPIATKKLAELKERS